MFFEKNVKFLAFFWHSNGNFPESQPLTFEIYLQVWLISMIDQILHNKLKLVAEDDGIWQLYKLDCQTWNFEKQIGLRTQKASNEIF